MWLVLRGCPSTGSGCAHSSRAEPEGIAELGGSVELAGFLQASASVAHSSSERALVIKNSRSWHHTPFYYGPRCTRSSRDGFETESFHGEPIKM